MPVTVPVTNKWDNEACTIARQDYGPEWYWCDFRQSIPMLLDMVHSVPHTVDVIVNMSDDSKVDWRGAEMHSRWLAKQWPARFPGQVVIVANPNNFAHIHLLFNPIRPKPRLVNTLAEARAVLAATSVDLAAD